MSIKHMSLCPKTRHEREEMGSNPSPTESIWAFIKHVSSSTFIKMISDVHENSAMSKSLHHLMTRQLKLSNLSRMPRRRVGTHQPLRLAPKPRPFHREAAARPFRVPIPPPTSCSPRACLGQKNTVLIREFMSRKKKVPDAFSSGS